MDDDTIEITFSEGAGDGRFVTAVVTLPPTTTPERAEDWLNRLGRAVRNRWAEREAEDAAKRRREG